MGQVSEDIINGICCQVCGQWMPEVSNRKSDIFINPPGYPRTCKDCQEYEKKYNKSLESD